MLNNIKKVEFVLENCESVIVPKKNFEYLDVKKIGDEDEPYFELKCKIKSLNDIERLPNFNFDTDTGLQRLAKYNDIVYIEITTEDNEIARLYMVWDYSHSSMTNRYQISKIYDYKTLELSITKDNYNENVARCSKFINENFNNVCNECWCKSKCDLLQKEKNVTVCEVFSYILKD